MAQRTLVVVLVNSSLHSQMKLEATLSLANRADDQETSELPIRRFLKSNSLDGKPVNLGVRESECVFVNAHVSAADST